MNIKDLGFPTDILIMALVIFLTFSLLLILIRVFVVGQAFRAGVGGDTVVERESISTTSISPDDLEKLPYYTYAAKSNESLVNCVVCLENFEDGDKCRLLPICKHSFQAQCVDAWLLKTPICPICRTNVNLRRLGQLVGEESRHFSDTSIEVSGSQTVQSSQFTDASLITDLTDALPTANNHLTTGFDVRESHTRESGEVIIELEQNQEKSTQYIARIESIQTKPTEATALDITSE